MAARNGSSFLAPWSSGCAVRRALLAVVLTALSTPSFADKVRISNLADVNFGSVTNLQSEARRSQSVCVYSNGAGNDYSVTATGSGVGGSFTLSNGPHSLPFDAEWSSSAGQSTGTKLVSNVALAGQVSTAGNQSCSSGPTSSASLSVVLRAADLSTATEGSYSGSLTLLIAAQ
jgi:hypothetical protein